MDPLADIDLNLLLALHHLLESASVRAAAEELGVGQPAMSASLARLRAALGDPLLLRAGRGMRRTPRADALRQPVAELIDRTRAVLAPTAPFDPARDPWIARVAMSDDTRPWLAPRLVGRVRAEAPAVDLRIYRLTQDSPSEGRTGAIDLAVFPDPTGITDDKHPDIDAFVVRPLHTVRFVVATSPEHPLAEIGWTPATYAEAHHVLVTRWSNSASEFADDALGRLGLARRVAVTVPTFAEATALVLQDPTLVTLIPDVLALGTGLRTWGVPWDGGPLQIYYAYHPRGARDPRLRWLRTALEEAASTAQSVGQSV